MEEKPRLVLHTAGEMGERWWPVSTCDCCLAKKLILSFIGNLTGGKEVRGR